jgi:hypothetical protein
MALFEIIYTSLATHDLSPEALAVLLDKARENNRALGVTGMMIYRQREFMQLLEGEQAVVQTLFDKIQSDPRHQQVSKIWDGAISERSFSTWGMAFVAPDELALQGRPGYEGVRARGLHARPGDSTGKKLLVCLRDDFLGAG